MSSTAKEQLSALQKSIDKDSDKNFKRQIEVIMDRFEGDMKRLTGVNMFDNTVDDHPEAVAVVVRTLSNLRHSRTDDCRAYLMERARAVATQEFIKNVSNSAALNKLNETGEDWS